ncbi:MAG: HAMP domain-containing histidine kinase, partial [Clostridia bacterium]|nr:HAMP domain-containing histidine kinase [Clostridia bacterium]
GGNGSFLYVIAQLNRIDSVIRVLQQQFFLITILALLFAFAFAYFMARRFSRPVEQLTKSARELALGNAEVTFRTEDAFGEIEELAGALQYAADEIAKSSELRRELMANVSHDLRTPLTMIKMYAEMIRDITGDNKEKREKNLKIIMDETDRLTLLVQDILELSKIEATNRKIDLSAFDICAMVQTILERFSVMREQGYTFELEAPEKVYVLGDKARIEQVLYNLLSNAVNYTGEDKRVRVRITSKFDCVRVEIIDSGPGIPKEEMATIWDRYYRAKTHVRSQMGTGLGLSIVKSILTAHNADFGIDSTLGVGSNFWFELKLPENSANKTLRLADNNIVSSEE